MKHTDEEIIKIKTAVAEMWQLVESQVKKSCKALLENDKVLAHEVLSREKSVDTYELYIDRECENYIALFNPVAVDLRFILSLMKINNNIERIGDFADGIARYVVYNQKDPMDSDLIEKLQLNKMFSEVLNMLTLCKNSLTTENTTLAGQVFSRDEIIDEINTNAISILSDYCSSHTDKIRDGLYLIGAIRRIERMGDRCNNIAEDIIFYVDAKELRHSK